MLSQAFLAALAVFICYGGNWITGQTMIERPLVVGLVTGLLMGDMRIGILMGASLEAIFFGTVNIGGVISAEPVTATAISTTFAITTGINHSAALTLAIPVGMLVAMFVMFLKNIFMNIFAPVVDKLAAKGEGHKLAVLHYVLWFFYFFVISIIPFIAVLLGSKPVSIFAKSIPQNVINGMTATGGLLPAVGFAMLMKLIWDNKLAVYYLLGFILTAYIKLPAVAVAAIGVIICVLIAQNDFKAKKNTSTVATASSNQAVNTKPMDEKEQEEEDFFS